MSGSDLYMASLKHYILLITLTQACSGESFRENSSIPTSDSGLLDSHSTGQLDASRPDSPILDGGSSLHSPEANLRDSGLVLDAQSQASPDAVAGHRDGAIQTGGDPCTDCRTGSFGERPCCKLIPERHCGVVFKGDGFSCIEYR